MRYGPFDDILKYDLASRPNHWDRDDVFDTCKYIASSVNAIIPIAYDYSCGYHGFSNLSPCIPLPFSIDNQPAISKPVNFKQLRKIRVLHGLTRVGHKVLQKFLQLLICSKTNSLTLPNSLLTGECLFPPI